MSHHSKTCNVIKFDFIIFFVTLFLKSELSRIKRENTRYLLQPLLSSRRDESAFIHSSESLEMFNATHFDREVPDLSNSRRTIR